MDADERISDALAAIDAHDLDAFDRAKCRAMVTAYVHAWDAIAIEPLEVEHEFSLPLVNPETNHESRTYKLGGKHDLIARLGDGRLCSTEHKTSSDQQSSEGGSSYQAKLALDGQVSMYFDGADAIGYPIDLVLYDIAVKPAIRPLIATPVEKRKYRKSDGALHANQRELDETADEFEARCMEAIAANPGAYLARVEVPRLETDRAEHQLNVWRLGKQVRAAERDSLDVQNPDACHRYGGVCAFWDVCTGVATLDDPSRFKRLDRTHAELESGDASTLTTSRLKSFRACQRLHRYEYGERVRPIRTTPALRFGTAFHAALETYWRARIAERAQESAAE